MKYIEHNIETNRKTPSNPFSIADLKLSTNSNFYFYSRSNYNLVLLNLSDTWLDSGRMSSLYDVEYFVYDLYLKDSWWHDLGEEEYDRRNDFFLKTDKFFFLKATTFSDYFSANQVDIPKDFKKSQSMFRLQTETLFSKAISLVSRDGKKDFFLKNFAHGLENMHEFLESDYLRKFNVNQSWQTLIYFWSRCTFRSSLPKILRFYKRSCLKVKVDERKILSDNMKKSDLLFEPHFVDHKIIWENLLRLNIRKLNPIFKYQILAVPKKTRKNSRGKSGRYRMVWKYVAPYRRDILVFRWFMQDLWHNEGRNLLERFSESLIRLVHNYKHTFMYENYRYIHYKIYFKFRLSLFKNYRTLKDVK